MFNFLAAAGIFHRPIEPANLPVFEDACWWETLAKVKSDSLSLTVGAET